MFPLSFRIFISNWIFVNSRQSTQFFDNKSRMFALLANLIGVSREKPGRKLPCVYIRWFTLFSFDPRSTITTPSTYSPTRWEKKRNGDMPGKAVGQWKNVERDAVMRGCSFRKIRWIRCVELF